MQGCVMFLVAEARLFGWTFEKFVAWTQAVGAPGELQYYLESLLTIFDSGTIQHEVATYTLHTTEEAFVVVKVSWTRAAPLLCQFGCRCSCSCCHCGCGAPI